MNDKLLNILRTIASQTPAGTLQQGGMASIPGANQASGALAKLIEYVKSIDGQGSVPQQAQPMLKQGGVSPDALKALRDRLIQGQYKTSNF